MKVSKGIHSCEGFKLVCLKFTHIEKNSIQFQIKNLPWQDTIKKLFDECKRSLFMNVLYFKNQVLYLTEKEKFFYFRIYTSLCISLQSFKIIQT